MFREMRRKKQLLTDAQTIEILNRRTAGTLAVSGDDDYPYAVPLSYAYADGKIYFHCAKEGHKLDGIRRNDKVTFSVIDRDDVIEETYTTHFQSVTIFGRARVLEESTEKRNALQVQARKYSPHYTEAAEKVIDVSWANVVCIEIAIEHMTGKAAIEIINGKA